MLDGKVVLVTGASRGIGKAIALLDAENHAHVIVNYNKNGKSAAELVDLIHEKGLSASIIKADVSSEDEVKDMFSSIKEKHSKLDVLVNNAGIMRNSLLALTSTELFDHTIDVNLKGTFLCTRYATNMMRKQRLGRIVNISSIVGLQGSEGQTAYSASKAAVIGFTRSAQKNLAGMGLPLMLLPQVL
jgi:3-oxoacyl-[acyl-carrier protein] reductase